MKRWRGGSRRWGRGGGWRTTLLRFDLWGECESIGSGVKILEQSGNVSVEASVALL